MIEDECRTMMENSVALRAALKECIPIGQYGLHFRMGSGLNYIIMSQVNHTEDGLEFMGTQFIIPTEGNVVLAGDALATFVKIVLGKDESGLTEHGKQIRGELRAEWEAAARKYGLEPN